jgi:predicted nucleotidyltransferase
MHPAIAQHRPGIAAICQRYGIRRLEVFGSAARASDFDPARSDADFLVEFASDVSSPGSSAIFGAKADLEALLGRGVDLVEPGAVRNPYVLASINRHRARHRFCSVTRVLFCGTCATRRWRSNRSPRAWTQRPTQPIRWRKRLWSANLKSLAKR